VNRPPGDYRASNTADYLMQESVELQEGGFRLLLQLRKV